MSSQKWWHVLSIFISFLKSQRSVLDLSVSLSLSLSVAYSILISFLSLSHSLAKRIHNSQWIFVKWKCAPYATLIHSSISTSHAQRWFAVVLRLCWHFVRPDISSNRNVCIPVHILFYSQLFSTNRQYEAFWFVILSVCRCWFFIDGAVADMHKLWIWSIDSIFDNVFCHTHIYTRTHVQIQTHTLTLTHSSCC